MTAAAEELCWKHSPIFFFRSFPSSCFPALKQGRANEWAAPKRSRVVRRRVRESFEAVVARPRRRRRAEATAAAAKVGAARLPALGKSLGDDALGVVVAVVVHVFHEVQDTRGRVAASGLGRLFSRQTRFRRLPQYLLGTVFAGLAVRLAIDGRR